jgi:hypothetical protein
MPECRKCRISTYRAYVRACARACACAYTGDMGQTYTSYTRAIPTRGGARATGAMLPLETSGVCFHRKHRTSRRAFPSGRRRKRVRFPTWEPAKPKEIVITRT